jgi:hypothetical protein
VIDHDPLADARARTRDALASNSWSSLTVTVGALGAVAGIAAVVAVGLLTKDLIAVPTLFLILGAAAFLSGTVVFLALEARRLCERSTVLRDLYNAQLQYEVLLRDARAAQDQLRDQNAQLIHQNAALQALIVTTTVRVAMERETP